MSHTPGPWDKGAFFEFREEDQPLLTAAPDLLKACEWLVRELVNSCDVADLMTDESADCIKNARAAIKKAKGL